MPKANDFDAIIMLSVSRWDHDLSSASISLARELSKTHKVFFVDYPFTIKDVIKDRKTKMIRNRMKALLWGKSIYTQIEAGNPNWIAVTPKAILPINWLPEGPLYNLFCDLNNKLFLKTVRRIVRDHQLKQYIFFNSYNPFYGYTLTADIKPALNIYQSRDNIKESEYVKRHGPRLEQVALKQATLRIATSQDLVEQLSSTQYPFTLFANAADVDLFRKAAHDGTVPPELQGTIKGPVIGYMGNICLRIDYDLVYKIAKRFPDHTLLMVGPRNDARHHDYDFEALGNVIFTGPKNIRQLPDYLRCMDCTILPFKVNALTKSIYPLKINEYLAGGKPVVSTAFSPDVEAFGDIIHVAGDHASFLEGIERSLRDDGPELKEKRMARAQQNSWPARVHQFWNLVERHS